MLTPVRGDDLPDQSSHAFAVEQKLKSLVVSVDFNNAKIDEALTALSASSKQVDPDHKGIDFVFQPEIPTLAQPITLTLNNVPVGVALHYVCELARVRYKIDNRLVSVIPMSMVGGGGDELIKRTFHVDPSFVETAETAGIIPSTPHPPQ